MTWQVVVAFISGLIVGGIIFGIIGYKRGVKKEHNSWRHFRMWSGDW